MKKQIAALAVSMLLIGVFFINDAFAGRAANRQVHQRHRIAQGIKGGELTKGETAVLAHEQKHIQGMKRWFWRDGELTANERFRLENAQDHASHHIYRLKHNDKEQ